MAALLPDLPDLDRIFQPEAQHGLGRNTHCFAAGDSL